MADLTYPLFPIFAFLGFILSLIPLPWHLQAWNSGTCYYMIWTSLACMNQFINSIVWHGNALNPAPVWCDICAHDNFLHRRLYWEDFLATRILLGTAVGIPASSVCIMRRLYQISSVHAVTITREEVSTKSSSSYSRPSLTYTHRNDVLSLLILLFVFYFQWFLLQFVSAHLFAMFLSSHSEICLRIFHTRSSV